MQDRASYQPPNSTPETKGVITGPFKPAEIIPAVHSLLDGSLIRWDTQWAQDDCLKQAVNVGSALNRLSDNIFWDQGPEIDEGLLLFRNDLESYTFGYDLFTSEKFPEAFNKLFIASLMYVGTLYRDNHSPLGENSAARAYNHTIANKYNELILALAKVDAKDLSHFVRFSNMLESASDQQMTSGAKAIGLRHVPQDMHSEIEIFSMRRQEAVTKVSEALFFAEKRVNQNWQWPQLEEALNLIAASKPRTALRLSEAFQDNLLKLDPHQGPVFLDINIQGLVSMMRAIQSVETTNNDSITNEELAKNPLQWPVRIPSHYMPVGIIGIASMFIGTLPEARMVETMQSIGKLAIEQRLERPWIIELLFAKFSNPKFSGMFQDLVETLDLPESTKGILLDKIPGKLWLGKNGRLQTTESGQERSNNYLLYSSQAPEIPNDPQEPNEYTPTIREPKIPENKLQTEVSIYDFVGEIGVMENDQVLEYLNKQRARRIFPEEEIDEKIVDLQEKFEMPKDEKTLIFHYPLNLQDAAAKEAKRLGIETVVITGNVVTFVIDKDTKDQPYSTNAINKKIPVAFTATLDQQGWLTLDAQDEQMNQNPSQDYLLLSLNMIVLDLASKKPQEQEIAEKRQAAKPTIDQWNRNSRGSLPRLNPILSTDSDVLIAVNTNGQTVFTTQS